LTLCATLMAAEDIFRRAAMLPSRQRRRHAASASLRYGRYFASYCRDSRRHAAIDDFRCRFSPMIRRRRQLKPPLSHYARSSTLHDCRHAMLPPLRQRLMPLRQPHAAAIFFIAATPPLRRFAMPPYADIL